MKKVRAKAKVTNIIRLVEEGFTQMEIKADQKECRILNSRVTAEAEEELLT